MKTRTRRVLGILPAVALLLSGLVLVAQPAAAGHLSCGSTVTASTTLDSDLGPCVGDGLIVTGSGITLDLGGHTITGNSTANTTATEQVGVRLRGVSNATVTNGSVTRFDAGVAVEGGSANTVSNLLVSDNINHSSLTGANNLCLFGDGITVSASSNNRIQFNKAIHNGPYSGISLVGNSDNNVVKGNQTANQTVSNVLPNGGPGPCGPFGAGSTVGRPNQDIGIRVEGPGANNNTVSENQVTGNQLEGISIHGYVCHPRSGPPGQPNTDNVISANLVANNGFADIRDGIAVLQQGPLGAVTCASFRNTIVGNTSTGNARDGVFVSSLSANNTISQNVVRRNGRDGIRLNGPFTRGGVNYPGAHDNTLTGNQGAGNGEHDGHDANPNCDNNQWRANGFGSVNQPCVATP